MNVLITGGKGRLGSCLRDVIMKRDGGVNNYYYFAGHSELDITNEESVNSYVNDNNIDLIINCAAYTDVSKSEDNPLLAYSINSDGARLLSNAINKRNGWIIQISTDYVYNGGPMESFYGEPFSPDDESASQEQLSVYARSKYLGEMAVKENNPDRYIIVRTSWLYSEYGGSFVKTMFNRICNHEQFTVPADQIGDLTYAMDLAEFLINLVEKHTNSIDSLECGTYNYSNSGVCSRFDVAMAVQDIIGIGYDGQIGTRYLDVNDRYEALRPHYTAMDTRKLKKLIGDDDYEPPYWRHSLEKCLKKIIDKNIW